MTRSPEREKPLDPALRDRLHLGSDAGLSLWFVRMSISLVDGFNRLLFRRPFFALRESEDLLTRLDGVKGPELVRAVMAQNGGTRISCHGLENVPRRGPVIIASTHPTGIFDFLAHASALHGHRSDIKVVANQEVERFLGTEMLVPVAINKDNRAQSGLQTRRAMLAHLDEGGALLIFGSGRVPNRVGGHLVEPDWRAGASHASAICGAPVIPASLDARNSDAYYRLRNLAQFVSGGSDRVGAMIASLRYLTDLLEKLGGSYRVHYGPAMAPGTQPHKLQAAAEQLVPGLYCQIVAPPGQETGQSSKSSG